jgi:hypothetical protein
MDCTRVHTKYFLFNIREMTESNARRLYENLCLKDLVVLARENGWHSCYATRHDDKQFDFRKGTVSLAKKMTDVSSKDLEIIPIGYNAKLPEKFFERLDVDRINEQVLYAFGRYADFSQIKACMEQGITGGRKRHVNSTLVKKGALESVEDGVIRFGQYPTAKVYVSEVKGKKRKAKRLAKDVKCGSTIFLPFRGGEYGIVSCRGKPRFIPSNDDNSDANDDDDDDDGGGWEENQSGDWHPMEEDDDFSTKQKHYYFYSTKPGYFKTTVAVKLAKKFNAGLINDPSNWMGVAEDAQFLIVDGYGPKRRFHMDDLKCLTAGDARTSYGNRKSYGDSYRPRPDAQLIIFSNHHLFACMGEWNAKLGRRVVTPETATLLSDRFHIVKLDEGAEGASTEREDREYYTAAPSDMPMTTRKRCLEFDFDDEATGPPSKNQKFKCLARIENIADTHDLYTFMAYVAKNESWIFPVLAEFYSPQNGEDLFETCLKRHEVDREDSAAMMFEWAILPHVIAAKNGIPYEPPRDPHCSEDDEEEEEEEEEDDDSYWEEALLAEEAYDA